MYFVLVFISFLPLYGLFNLAAWADPATRAMGVMHLPLLVVPITALWLVRPRPQTRFSDA